MRKSSNPFWRGLSVQLVAVTVLPLTLLLLVIAFASVTIHQRDMCALVGERDERAVQAATATSELHHRMASISSLAAFAQSSQDLTFDEVLGTSPDLLSDFEGGVAFLDGEGKLLMSADRRELWNAIVQNLQRCVSHHSRSPVR